MSEVLLPFEEQKVIRASVAMAMLYDSGGNTVYQLLRNDHPHAPNKFYPPTNEAIDDEVAVPGFVGLIQHKGVKFEDSGEPNVIATVRKVKDYEKDGKTVTRDTATIIFAAPLAEGIDIKQLNRVVNDTDDARKAAAHVFLSREEVEGIISAGGPIRNPSIVRPAVDQLDKLRVAYEYGEKEGFSPIRIGEIEGFEEFVEAHPRRAGTFTF